MPHAFGAPLVGDDVDAVSDTLAFPNVVALCLSVTSGFEDGFIGTLGETGSAGDTLFRDE
jgi:hypothetical protein